MPKAAESALRKPGGRSSRFSRRGPCRSRPRTRTRLRSASRAPWRRRAANRLKSGHGQYREPGFGRVSCCEATFQAGSPCMPSDSGPAIGGRPSTDVSTCQGSFVLRLSNRLPSTRAMREEATLMNVDPISRAELVKASDALTKAKADEDPHRIAEAQHQWAKPLDRVRQRQARAARGPIPHVGGSQAGTAAGSGSGRAGRRG